MAPSWHCLIALFKCTYVKMQAGVWYQKCYDPECRAYRSEAMPLPLQLAAQLPSKADVAGPKLQESACRRREGERTFDSASVQMQQSGSRCCTAAKACCALDPPAEGQAPGIGPTLQQHAAYEPGDQRHASSPEAGSTSAVPGCMQLEACGPDGLSSAAVHGKELECCWQQNQAGVYANGEDDDEVD